jgi:ribosomal protein S18 acetylase RimI-like enzyme
MPPFPRTPHYLIDRATLDDAISVREVVRASVPVLYLPLIEPFLEQGLTGHSAEETVLVSRDREAGAITGVAVVGIVAGTLGAGRIRGVCVAPLARRRGVGRALLNESMEVLTESGARFALVELADEPEMRFLSALLEAGGFAEEARAADLVRDGVAMRYLRRENVRA